MIAYRSARRAIDTTGVLAHADDPLRFLIEFGEIEAAIADQLCPERDALRPRMARMREVSIEAARAFVTGQANVKKLLPRLRLPAKIDIAVPEGYAWYGLHPGRYIDPAERFWREHHPRRAVVIGIRSIGTSLSAVVAALLELRGCAVASYTVRPHGHPFHRELHLADDFRRALTTARDAYYLVVDEGPGLSGSSFASVAEALSSQGIADERIVFVPGWMADPDAFRSRGAAARWNIHPKYPAAEASVPAEALIDLSAGGWRDMVYSDEWQYPAVQPQHEVQKFLCRAGDAPAILRFAGLGRYGHEKLDRARMLAAAGFCAAPISLENGWLKMPFQPGRPLTVDDLSNELLDTMARYIAFRRRAFATGTSVRTDELAEMIRVNTRQEPPSPGKAEATIVDGRMMPHEWIGGPVSFFKTDALDHGDNHFQPGPTDICWDLAGAMIEWQLEERRRSWLLKRYIRHSGDRGVGQRLPFYLLAYVAFRIGYTHTAASALPPGGERERFEKLHREYCAIAEMRHLTAAR